MKTSCSQPVDRRVAGLRVREVAGVLVGLDFEGRGQRFAGAGGRVVGERAGPGCSPAVGLPMQLVSARPGQPAGLPGAPLGKRWASWLGVGGEAPEGQVGAGQRGQLGDVLDGEAQAVVGAGAHRDRDRDRDVQGRDDEGEARGLVCSGARGRRSARCRAGSSGCLRSWRGP